MNIHLRRLIAVLFISTFVIITPILIFYTAGYRYDAKKNSIEKAGALLLETEPKSAQVFINNEFKKNTPARVNNLLPGDYIVTITKDGYYNWEKKLTVKSQETTFAENIILFKQNQPDLISTTNIDFLSFSPKNSFALYKTNQFNQEYLYLLNLNNQKELLVYNNNSNLENLTTTWSFSADKLLVQDNQKTFALLTSTPTTETDLTEIVAKNGLYNLKWDQYNSNILYGQNQKNLFEYNFLTNQVKKIYSSTREVFDYLVNGNDIYDLTALNQKFFLTKHKAENPSYNKLLEINNNAYQIKQVIEDKLVLIDQTNNIFYLTNLDLDNVLFYQENFINFDYNEKTKLLLITSNQEVNSLDLNQPNLTKNTIVRYSNNEEKAVWHNNTNYIFNLRDNFLSIVELDNRDKRNIIELPETNISNFNVSNNFKYLIYLKNNSLYKFDLE